MEEEQLLTCNHGNQSLGSGSSSSPGSQAFDQPCLSSFLFLLLPSAFTHKLGEKKPGDMPPCAQYVIGKDQRILVFISRGYGYPKPSLPLEEPFPLRAPLATLLHQCFWYHLGAAIFSPREHKIQSIPTPAFALFILKLFLLICRNRRTVCLLNTT